MGADDGGRLLRESAYRLLDEGAQHLKRTGQRIQSLVNPRPTFPLWWWEVLEREFEELHGPLPYRRDSYLEAEDVRCELALGELSGTRPGGNVGALEQIRRRIAPGLLDSVDPDGLRRILNALIDGPQPLFDGDHLHPNAVEREMLEIYRAPPLPDEQSRLLNRMLLERAFSEDAVTRLEAKRRRLLYAEIHRLRGQALVRSALCLSGGGIRSASFALGALQGLASLGLLRKMDYLSTVSGGGYVGSWLSCWIHRHPRGMEGVLAELDDEERGRREAPPLRFLRDYSRFLNPVGGLFSVDTWTWVGIYLRNLSINWLVWLPLLICLVLLPRLYQSMLYALQLDADVIFGLMCLAAVTSLVSITVNRPSLRDPGREERWLGLGAQGRIVVFGVVPLALFVLCFNLLAWKQSHPQIGGGASGLFQLVTAKEWAFIAFGEGLVLVGWLIAVRKLNAFSWRLARELAAMLFAGAIAWSLLLVVFHYTQSDPQGLSIAFAGLQVGFPLVYGIAAFPLSMTIVLLGMTVFVALVSKPAWIEDEDREWWARFGAWLLIAMAAWSVASAVSSIGPALLVAAPHIVGSLGGVSGLVAVLLGKSPISPARENAAAKSARGWLEAAWKVLGSRVLLVSALVFVLVLLSAVALGAGWALEALVEVTRKSWDIWTPFEQAVLSRRMADGTLAQVCGADPQRLHTDLSFLGNPQLSLDAACQVGPVLVVTMLSLALVFMFLIGWATNFNKFSLHAAYRLRIVRAFLGASRGRDRRPNPFTGFDPMDDVRMHELRPGLLGAADLRDSCGLAASLAKRGERDALEPLRTLLRAHDADQTLELRLGEFRGTRYVPRALEKDMVQVLNRVLENENLAQALEVGDPLRREAAARFREGRRILANRMVLDAALADVLQPYPLPPPPPHKLFHVVNLTLNMVHGKRLAWQDRKAEPFTVTPLHCGSFYEGYRSSREYGGTQGISIGTAAAISGAAVSPNMGYSSSPLITLLLALFNVRLGWWLGNPGVAGHQHYRASEPAFAVGTLIQEALGLTDNRHPYVYLSDGGHFDNMGLYEMVLRRAGFIILVDGEADPDYRFEGLGNAIRKVRIDLGVEITFDRMSMAKGVLAANHHLAVGRIGYRDADGGDAEDGVLLYVKPVLCGREPRDVLHYAASHEDFPQQPTADQFFGEAQFESYRKLGHYAIRSSLPAVNDQARWWWPYGSLGAK